MTESQPLGSGFARLHDSGSIRIGRVIHVYVLMFTYTNIYINIQNNLIGGHFGLAGPPHCPYILHHRFCSTSA